MTHQENTETAVTEHGTPLISLIIPVYNVEPYLRECLDSVRAQTYEKTEVLIVDDGSTDRSGRICDEYELCDKRFHVFHTENNGLAQARNYALDRAKGEYIAFLDSDDRMEKETLEKLMAASLFYDADITACGICSFWVNKTSKKESKLTSPILLEGDELSAQAASMDILLSPVWNKLYRRKLFSEFRFPKGRLFEDTFILYRLVLSSKRAVRIPDALIHYRRRIGSLINTCSAKT